MSEEIVKEVELEEGREHSGKNCWILKFRGIESVEEVISNYFQEEHTNAFF
jgi:hypothetical protein